MPAWARSAYTYAAWHRTCTFTETDDYLSSEAHMKRSVSWAKAFYDPNIFYFASINASIKEALRYTQTNTKVQFDLCARLFTKKSIRSGCWIPFRDKHYFGYVTRPLGSAINVTRDCFRLRAVTDDFSAVTGIYKMVHLVTLKKLAVMNMHHFCLLT